MPSSNILKASIAFALISLAPAAAQDPRPSRQIGRVEANAALARGVNADILNRSFRTLSEFSFRNLSRANLATLSAPSAEPQAMAISPSAECQFTITKSYNPLPPSAGAAFTVTTRIENTGAACNQPNGVYFYDYQSQTNVLSTSNYSPVNLSLTPSAHFFLVEPNPTGMNQSTTYLNPWRVDIFHFAGAIPAGWVFQFDRQLATVTSPTAPNAVEWPNSPPITYSCMFGAHQLNFDIGAPSSSTNLGGYDYKECAVAQVTTCVPIAQLPDLDAWWRFDGNGTEQVYGNNLQGSISSSVYVPGYVGQGFRNSTSATIQAYNPPYDAALNLGRGDFTLDLWVNVPASLTGLSHQTIIDHRMYSGPGYMLTLSGGRLSFWMEDSGGATAFAHTTNLAGAGWHFVAISVERDNPSGLLFYVRPGAPSFGAATIVTHNPTPRSGNINTVGTFHFQFSYPVSATIDELELFDRALTVADIDALYNAHHSGKCR